MSVAHMHLLLHGLVNGNTCHCFEAIGSADMNTESNRSLNLKVANKKCNLHCLEYQVKSVEERQGRWQFTSPSYDYNIMLTVKSKAI